ncbi:MAG: isoleucine--tRNA ligase [Candidatus Saccharibacteria bacterium]|nr:isoleucine--tRNA ligase [Candidatus Saccharibacteria bacterium]
MKFTHGTRRRAAEYEKDWVQRWKDDQTFQKSVAQRPADNAYVFYDGPPFITGVPHHGTLLSSIVKDAVPRYWTMKGKRVERRWGWDCHGLPAENFVEKQMNIVDRRQIVTSSDQPAPLDKDGNPLPTISLERYITKARESMVANSETWQGVIDRIGRWVDFTGAYRTMDKDFMESVWWAFKQLYEAGKIYEGEKVLMYDTKFATPVSKAEVTMDNDAYQTVTDPSVYVRFKLVGEDAAILAWTTTPWTLPANLMLAVNPDMTYCEVLVDGEKLILAEEALERTLQDEKHQLLNYEVLRTFPGSELVGKKYRPLGTGSTWPDSDKIHTIYTADFVTNESGTGIVHIAPAYGEDDFELGKANGIAPFHVIDDNGYYTDSNYKGLEVWDNNKFIAKDLKEKGAVWKIEYIRHEYPFNPRSKQRIMYRAIPSWFFDIQGQKPLMLDENEHINWFPRHLKHGRFAKNIEQAPDWNLSRDRFWATAMPVWKGDRGTVKVVGSYAELKELSGVELDDYHRPWVDDITFTIDGETFTRIDKVLDCWFESGSMPFAQLHYPFENQATFEQNYPADFIVEYIGQVRAWFYYVHAVNVALAEIGAFGEAGAQHKNAYSNVITTGVVAGNDGRKMSKSLGNFTDPNELMDKFSADSLRFLLLSSPLLNGEDFALHDKDVGDVARKLAMIWNMYDFFTMYAEVDGWEFDGELRDPLDELTNPLDIWIISRLHQLVAEVERHIDTYNIPDALSPILPFLDDASNWYVRRSRRRFWKSEDDGDKSDAYRTLHYVLVRLSYLLAPFTPFLAEELYHNLTGDNESIHLKDWLPAGAVNEQVLADMARTRELINNGLSLRMKQDEHQVSIKVRQPLQCAVYAGAKLAEYYEQIMAEELNVKEVRWVENQDEHLADYGLTEGVVKPESWVEIDKTITPELKREGLMREVIRHVQSARKKAGLQVDDRIMLHLVVGAEPASQPAAPGQVQPADDAAAQLRQALTEHADTIASETLATMQQPGDVLYQTTAMVDGAELQMSLAKA